MLNSSKKNIFFEFISIFCCIFSFFIGPIQSIFVIGVIAFILICTYPRLYNNLSSLVYSDSGKIILLSNILILSTNLLFSLINKTFDISYFMTLSMQFIKIIIIFMVVSCFNVKGKEIEHYEKMFVKLFVIQSVIELAAFMNSKLAGIMLYFNHAYLIAENYGGMRGLALCGATGWALAVLYAITFLFYTKNRIVENTHFSIKDVIIGLVLFLGVMFAGRSAYLGIIISIIYFLLYTNKKQRKFLIIFKFVIYLLVVFVFFVAIVYIFAAEKLTIFIDKVLPWAFEFFYKKQSSGKLSTTSTNILINMWKKAAFITERTFIIGDGFFTDPNTGKYYQKVDIGYLRNLFYWGIIGTSLLYISYIFVFIPKYLRSNNNIRLFIFAILLTVFILELKAMAVFSSHLCTTMLFVWLLLDERIRIENKKSIMENELI